MLPRSYLFVPADRPDRFAKAVESGADAIVVDLEDATAWSNKASAREAVHDWLHAGHPEGVEVWVRVNPGALLVEDLEAAMGADGVFLPKVNGPGMVEDAASRVGDDLAIIAMIETARGLLRAEEIGGHDAVTALMIGEFDLGADLGIRYDTMGTDLDSARLRVVTVSAAYGLRPAIAGVEPAFTDVDRLRRGTDRLATMGFGARGCIHPVQVPTVNAVFTPSPAEIAEAHDVIGRYEAAQADGAGVFLDARGGMMDEAMVRHARRVVDRAG
jgi:citrate lyase subunit beta/citryl-CoA lyase